MKGNKIRFNDFKIFPYKGEIYVFDIEKASCIL